MENRLQLTITHVRKSVKFPFYEYSQEWDNLIKTYVKLKKILNKDVIKYAIGYQTIILIHFESKQYFNEFKKNSVYKKENVNLANYVKNNDYLTSFVIQEYNLYDGVLNTQIKCLTSDKKIEWDTEKFKTTDEIDRIVLGFNLQI
jgi:hypothetical protein